MSSEDQWDCGREWLYYDLKCEMKSGRGMQMYIYAFVGCILRFDG